MIEVDIDLKTVSIGLAAPRLMKAIFGAEAGHISAFYEQLSA
jgi:hypothetical protein